MESGKLQPPRATYALLKPYDEVGPDDNDADKYMAMEQPASRHSPLYSLGYIQPRCVQFGF
jgi:hypothetical protein